jgi:hypothetical protein
MQKRISGLVWRIVASVLVPLYYPEYRKLLFRSYTLSARLQLLCTFFAVTSPFATPALLWLTRRWLDRLRDDVAEFGRMVRAPRAQVAMPRAQVMPQLGNDGGFQNPWT